MARLKRKRKKLTQHQRDRLAQKIRGGRSMDRRQSWETTRHLMDYLKILNVGLSQITSDLIKRHPRRKTKILDVGAGESLALAELKQRFGSKIETHALNLSKPKDVQVDRLHLGAIETKIIKDKKGRQEKFDLIVSVHGGFQYSLFPIRSLEKICNMLTVGGQAHLGPVPADPDRTYLKEMAASMEKQGFRVKLSELKFLHINMSVTRLKNKKLKLKEFYRETA
jgi:hypothetical protein